MEFLIEALLSTLIWLVAIAGPFVLMAVGSVTVLRWLVHRSGSRQAEGKGDKVK